MLQELRWGGAAAVLAVAMGLVGVGGATTDAQSKRAPAPAKGKAAAKAKPAPAPPEVTISVVGFRVVGQPVGETEYGELTAFGARQGIEVALGVRVPEGVTLLDADEDESSVDAMTDDQGLDLAQGPEFDFSPNLTADARGLVTSLRVGALPSPTAREFRVSGHLAVKTAQGERTERAAKVTLAKGQAFKVGGAAYTVEDVEADGEESYVSLAMTRAVYEGIKDIRFLDASGTAVEASMSMRGYSMDDANMAYRVTGAAKVTAVEVVRYENPLTQKVPFSLTVSLGSVR